MTEDNDKGSPETYKNTFIKVIYSIQSTVISLRVQNKENNSIEKGTCKSNFIEFSSNITTASNLFALLHIEIPWRY